MINVSVIVPVYNVELYLRECLDSIINQSLKEIEIICIDDCSTDNSYSILEEYQNKDNRIKLIKHEENKGLGPSRNSGLKIAKGEYISFIDSDDYISLDFLENLYNTAKKYDSDVVSTLSIYKGETKLFDYTLLDDNISKVSIIDEKFDTPEYLFMTAWNKIYCRNFLLKNNLFFMDIQSGPEDEDFYQRILVNSPRTSYNHKSIYYYRQREDSIINKLYLDENILLDNSINTVKLIENSISYTKDKNPDLLEYILKRAFIILFHRFNSFTCTILQMQFYSYLHDFCMKFSISRSILNNYEYEHYTLIKNAKSYSDYTIIFLKQNVNDINMKLEELNQKYSKIVNKICWFIPIKNLRDKVINNLLS